MKYSKQREEILKYVKSAKSHPTAKDIYSILRKNIPNISLGTVYRNLDNLSSEGKIKRLNSIGSEDRFDGDVYPHYHMICNGCGRIFDLYTNYFEEMNSKIENITGIKVLSHETVFNVICPKCNVKK